jgi:hypothetical protein
MASAACSDEEFIKLFRELGSPQAIAETLGISVRNVFARRNRLEQKHGIELLSFSKHSRITNVTHEQKIYSELKRRGCCGFLRRSLLAWASYNRAQGFACGRK